MQRLGCKCVPALVSSSEQIRYALKISYIPFICRFMQRRGLRFISAFTHIQMDVFLSFSPIHTPYCRSTKRSQTGQRSIICAHFCASVRRLFVRRGYGDSAAKLRAEQSAVKSFKHCFATRSAARRAVLKQFKLFQCVGCFLRNGNSSFFKRVSCRIARCVFQLLFDFRFFCF